MSCTLSFRPVRYRQVIWSTLRLGYDVIIDFQVAAISAGIANLIQVPPKEGCGREEEVGGAKVWTKRGQMAFEALMRMLDNKVLY